jgi:hypothetical protein
VWQAYLSAILKWLRENRISATVGDYCEFAGISVAKYRRKCGNELKHSVHAYALKSAPSRSRPWRGEIASSGGADRKAESEGRKLRRENRALKERVVGADAEVERLRRVVAASDGVVAQLQTFVDTLLYEVCRDKPARAREVGGLIQAVADGSVPREFLEVIREVGRDMRGVTSGASVARTGK